MKYKNTKVKFRMQIALLDVKQTKIAGTVKITFISKLLNREVI